ncbi:hypothetical protein HK405_015142 [Cladochytrium tenue]|nr:hypothetical protein HK405_015142 [Cladochytrium tenue]
MPTDLTGATSLQATTTATTPGRPTPLVAPTAPPLARSHGDYPVLDAAATDARFAGLTRRPLARHFGLTGLAAHHTTLAPGAASSLRHRHAHQDEFVYVLAGRPTLYAGPDDVADVAELGVRLEPGACVGFAAGDGVAHCLVNETDEDVALLEVGSRSRTEMVVYPDYDLLGDFGGPGGSFRYTHRDGTPY